MDTPTLLLLVIAVAVSLLAWCARELLKLAGELLTLVRIGHREARKTDMIGVLLGALAPLFASYVASTTAEPARAPFDWDTDAKAVRTNERRATVEYLRACAATERDLARAEPIPGGPSADARDHAATALEKAADTLVFGGDA